MTKRNDRKKTLEMMSSIPARMEQLRYEAKNRDGVIPQIIDPYTDPIVKPQIDYAEKNYKLVKRYTPGPLDTPFDHTTRYQTRLVDFMGNDSFEPVVGNQQILYTYTVSGGSKLIITNFCFWADLYLVPAFDYPVFAEKMEFFGLFDFVISVNGKIPGDITYATQSELVRHEGWTILSNDPERDSNPNHGGIVFPVGSRQKIQIIFRNHMYAYGAVGIYGVLRKVANVGFRLRGFLSSVNQEEK